MNRIDLILWILAAIFFAFAALGVPGGPKERPDPYLNWLGLGLFCATLTVLV